MFRLSAVHRILVLCGLALLPHQAHAQQNSPTPESSRFGGVHEFNFYASHSWHAGPVLGFVRNTTYTTLVARYSYQLREYSFATLRWSPEVTVLADLFEPAPSPDNIHTGVPLHSYGGGVSPGNLQLVVTRFGRVQPYLNSDSGLLLYNHAVLADGGTQFMFTVDAGGGANIFVSHRDAVTLNFRYQHQSNADIGIHNPGADAEMFCLGFSHFFNLQPKHRH